MRVIRRRCLWVAGACAAVAWLLLPAGVANGQSAEGTGSAGVTITLPGFADPPGHADVDACAGNAEFPVHVSEPTQLVKNEQERVTSQLPSGTILATEEDRGPGEPGALGRWARTDQDFEIEFVEWEIACASSEVRALRDPDTVRRYWVRLPTPGSIVPGLLGTVIARLEAPELTFTPWDDEFGWVYVQVSTDFRVAPIPDIYEELTITNVAGNATGWVRAEPSRLTYLPGEPSGKLVECSYEQSQFQYSPDVPGPCSYPYQFSSAIGVDDVFVNRTTLFWEVTSSSPLVIEDLQSWREEAIAVAEIQAVVNAD